jgi:hypothetical protein
MKETSLNEMRKALKQIDAKEICYYKWEAGGAYTVIATDGKQYGASVKLGETQNIEMLEQLGLPMYNYCPYN